MTTNLSIEIQRQYRSTWLRAIKKWTALIGFNATMGFALGMMLLWSSPLPGRPVQEGGWVAGMLLAIAMWIGLFATAELWLRKRNADHIINVMTWAAIGRICVSSVLVIDFAVGAWIERHVAERFELNWGFCGSFIRTHAVACSFWLIWLVFCLLQLAMNSQKNPRISQHTTRGVSAETTISEMAPADETKAI